MNPQLDTRMVVREGYKYVYRPGDVDELYDLQFDLAELHNLIADAGHDHVRSDLLGVLYGHMRETDDPLLTRFWDSYGPFAG